MTGKTALTGQAWFECGAKGFANGYSYPIWPDDGIIRRVRLHFRSRCDSRAITNVIAGNLAVKTNGTEQVQPIACIWLFGRTLQRINETETENTW